MIVSLTIYVREIRDKEKLVSARLWQKQRQTRRVLSADHLLESCEAMLCTTKAISEPPVPNAKGHTLVEGDVPQLSASAALSAPGRVILWLAAARKPLVQTAASCCLPRTIIPS